jgi:hypothetical protein
MPASILPRLTAQAAHPEVGLLCFGEWLMCRLDATLHVSLCLPPLAVPASGGDAAILSSAFFFSLATVRLGTYARRIKSVELAAAKSVVLGLAAFATFLIASGSMLAAGDPISDLWPGYTNPVAWGVMIYSALGPGALAAFLHAKVRWRLELWLWVWSGGMPAAAWRRCCKVPDGFNVDCGMRESLQSLAC